MASPFKLYFMKKYNHFPNLFTYGSKNTSKSTSVKFFTIDFYKHIPFAFSPDAIEGQESHVDDWGSSSTFPLIHDEIQTGKKGAAKEKSKATAILPHTKKEKGGQELGVYKEIIAASAYCSNPYIEAFKDPTFINKTIIIQFFMRDILTENPQWYYFHQRLLKKSLFSIEYDHTKDWDDSNIDTMIKKISTIYRDEIRDLKITDIRLRQEVMIILFGIILFKEVFGIELPIKGIAQLLITGHTYGSEDLKEYLKTYCFYAFKLFLEERKIEQIDFTKVSYIKYKYPFVHCGLSIKFTKVKHGKFKRWYYTFLTLNEKDFNSFYKQRKFNKPELFNYLNEITKNKELLYLGNTRVRYFDKVMDALLISPEIFEVLKPKEEMAKNVLYNMFEERLKHGTREMT